MNLVSNALKFTHKGYVAISASLIKKEEDQDLTALLDILSNDDKTLETIDKYELEVKVRDTGVGISSANQR